MEEKQVKQRENNYDLLRCVCAVMVVILHAGASYEQSSIELYARAGTFFQAVTRTAVPCFVMLSGAFLLGDGRWKHYSCAAKQTKRAILFPTVFYSLFFMGLSFSTYYMEIRQLLTEK